MNYYACTKNTISASFLFLYSIIAVRWAHLNYKNLSDFFYSDVWKIFICRYYRYLKLIYLIFALINYAMLRALEIHFNSLQIFQSIKVLIISSLYNRLILLSFCVKLKPIKKCYNINYIDLKLRLFNHNAKF